MAVKSPSLIKVKTKGHVRPTVPPPIPVPKPFSLTLDITNTPENATLLRRIGVGDAHATEALATVLIDLFIKTLRDKVNGDWKDQLDVTTGLVNS